MNHRCLLRAKARDNPTICGEHPRDRARQQQFFRRLLLYLARGGSFARRRNDGPEKPAAKLVRALPVFMPPSTTIVVPVIHSASSLARKVAIAAMSSGLPARG